MAERDWAEDLVRALEADLGRQLNHSLSLRVVAALRDAHARGLAEGRDAERQRAAAVCEAQRLAFLGTNGLDRGYGAEKCRAAILLGDDTTAPQPHGPPVTADPAENTCGACSLWWPPDRLGRTLGWCRVAREDGVAEDGAENPAHTLLQTFADDACDIGAWRAKGEGKP